MLKEHYKVYEEKMKKSVEAVERDFGAVRAGRNVAENHQYHNAMQLQKLGAAVVVEEKELTGEKLIGIVDKLTKDPAELMLMGAKARALAQPDSLDKICENLDRLMKTTA